MNLQMDRETLLKPLQAVVGVVERRQTMPILANALVVTDGESLSFTATDLEVELVANTSVAKAEAGEITVPARKFLDICRMLPEEADVELSVDGERAVIRSGRSRFALATLPAAEFPAVEELEGVVGFEIAQGQLKRALEQTQFAMAQQDVRYYLNGLLLEVRDGGLRTVGTDGHRLSLCDVPADTGQAEARQVIVPRKGVLELQRLLEDSDATANVRIGSSHVRVELPTMRFTSKLIDGRFPDYERVLPKGGDKRIRIRRQTLRQALNRAAILSNEKYRGIRFELAEGRLGIQANNPEQETAEEEIEVDYKGESLEAGFNVSYLLDPLAALDGEEIELELRDGNSSCLVRALEDDSSLHVVMPMRL